MARARPLAELIDPCLGDALKKQGFARSTLILHWADIVGERLASFCAPAKIDWPRRASEDAPPQPATLVVRVESAFALELQHLAPMVIERINAHLGWRCIGRIVLKQAPLPRRAPKAQPKPPPSPATTARAREATEGVTEERLQQALIRFGEAVLGRSRPEGPRTKS